MNDGSAPINGTEIVMCRSEEMKGGFTEISLGSGERQASPESQTRLASPAASPRRFISVVVHTKHYRCLLIS